MAVRQRTIEAVRTDWWDMPNHDRDDVDGFAQRTTQRVNAAQIVTATLTAGFIAEVMRAKGQTAAPIDYTAITAVRNVDPMTEWTRPGVQLWADLARGTDWLTAMNKATDRASKLVATDLQMVKPAVTHQATSRVDAVRGYERIVGANPCDLCQEAAGTLYASALDFELHANCSCDLVPVIGDPTFTNADAFSIPASEEHTEIGPLLT